MNAKRDREFDRRMNNWRLWRLSEGGFVAATISQVYRLTPRPPRSENIMPILAGEAARTDEAVYALPVSLRRVVEVWYLTGGTLNAKRTMLGCRRERMFELLAQAKTVIERFVYESGPGGMESRASNRGVGKS